MESAEEIQFNKDKISKMAKSQPKNLGEMGERRNKDAGGYEETV
jgi:hypothetical protein